MHIGRPKIHARCSSSKWCHSLRDIKGPGELVQQSIQFLGASSTCRVCSTSNQSAPIFQQFPAEIPSEPNLRCFWSRTGTVNLHLLRNLHGSLVMCIEYIMISCDFIVSSKLHHECKASSSIRASCRLQ